MDGRILRSGIGLGSKGPFRVLTQYHVGSSYGEFQHGIYGWLFNIQGSKAKLWRLDTTTVVGKWLALLGVWRHLS